MKARFLIVFAALHTLVACSGQQMAEKALVERPSGEANIELTIAGVSSAKGLVYGAVYIKAEGFPDDREQAHTYAKAPATDAVDGVIRLQLGPVPAGWVVIAVLHDEDGDEELSFNGLGIPKEEYGFSLDPDSVFGPPDFDDAAVYIEPGETRALTVNIQ